MNKPARAFAYCNGAFFIGAIVYVFTQGFIPYIEQPGTLATIILVAYMLIYGNLALVLGRRFIKKDTGMEYIPFAMAFILLLPALVLTNITDIFQTTSALLFYYLCIATAAFLGAHLGIKSGKKKREITETS